MSFVRVWVVLCSMNASNSDGHLWLMLSASCIGDFSRYGNNGAVCFIVRHSYFSSSITFSINYLFVAIDIVNFAHNNWYDLFL